MTSPKITTKPIDTSYLNSFPSFIQAHSPTIDNALKSFLNHQFKDSRLHLEKAMQYSVFAPSKRIRPLLMLATQSLFNSNFESIMSLACAVEYVHTYSLIHDDLPAMDNDDMRRGQPSCHKKYGEDIAILAGDALQAFAFEVALTHLPTYFSNEKVIQCLKMMSETFGIKGMAGGQVLDLKINTTLPEIDHLKQTHLLKTGELIKLSIMLPVILSEASEPSKELLNQFGLKLGLIFQIVDDILDETSTSSSFGKSLHKDRDQQKLTYVTLLGLEKATSQLEKEKESALQILDLIKDLDTSLLKSIVEYMIKRSH